MTAPRPTATRRVLALAACLTLVTSACMFNDDDGDSASGGGGTFDAVESGLPSDPQPTRGGQVVYGLEAETGASNSEGTVGTGWCMPEAQIAISGMQVSRALFDPLVVPDAEGEYVPYLAKSVSPNDDFTEWTITLRPNVKFHDGSDLTATVLKNNIDAYRGAYIDANGDKPRNSLLFRIVFEPIEEVVADNEDTVTVKMSQPWVAFDAALYSSGRMLVVAQAQLDADQETCATKPIGTGPFKEAGWVPNVSFKTQRWDGYWQIAPDGKPYPYLDAIEFRPIANSDARITALQQGDINMMHTSNVADMVDNLAQLRDSGEINLLTSDERTETSYVMFNTNNAELNELGVRKAVAQAIDREALNDVQNEGEATLASGPFAPEVLGHLDDAGAPTYDPEASKKAAAAMKKDGKKLSYRLLTSSGPATIRLSGLLKEQLEAVGFDIRITVTTEADLINQTLAGQYDISVFRNQPGDDPDSNVHWWTGGSLLNFGRFKDDVIDENLAKGRVDSDPEVRRKAYETVNRQISSQVYNYYLWFAPWAVAEASNVHGILGPPLPGQEQEPPGRIVTGHPLLGVWIDKN